MSDKIKSKIAALLAKAKGTDNEHEAAAFMAKAQEMLEQHQIDIGDLLDADDPVNKGGIYDASGKWVPSWHKDLYNALARLYGCRPIQVNYYVGLKRTWRVELVGRESAVATTELMFPWIKDECNRLGRELAKETGVDAARGQRSVGNALVLRIQKLCREMVEDRPRTEAAAKNALVTLDRVNQVVEQLYPNLKAGRKTTISTSKSATAAAASIGLHRQATGSSALRIGGR